MKERIQKDLDLLTENISDPRGKPMLRATLTLGLRDLGHAPEEVEDVLNEFYHETIH